MEKTAHHIGAGVLLALTLGLAITMSVIIPFASAAPARADALVLVVGPPWSGGAAALVERTGGRLVGPVQAPFAALAQFDGVLPDAQLRAMGAWAVTDGQRIALICGIEGIP
ncbi:hypothetical protein [Tropicibacter naphthalenivorans]|uniref:Uncharacterized protein n=1 Tax=Tropicibacter naphthalenivorans TaxID=441103 RepID=A0A0N7LZE8_9RHOB|nr:hypothetical protein [Tropicibacter naphthalenivorans]CUH77465.1 hypothetical protein TRN7648_01489 [Tropicibacter naphthalenivorans]SMC57223.1 hypothetical protein SAMN04488093_102128 [Tropicibacter naphthalenivorans]